MKEKSGFLTNFCAAAVGFVGGSVLVASAYGINLMDLAVDQIRQHKNETVPCVDLQGTPMNVPACK